MQDDLKALGKRLRDARKNARMTQQEVARILSLSKQLVCHWEGGNSQISIHDLHRVSMIYGVSMEWLLIGGKAPAATPASTGVKLRLTRGRIVPKASQKEVIEIALGRLDPDLVKERRQTYAECSANSLSFEILDNAMDGGATPFKQGHIVTVDREKLPEPGDCVTFVVAETGDILFRRYKSSGFGKKPLTPPFKLAADNPNFDEIEITDANTVTFLGTLVEHVIVASR